MGQYWYAVNLDKKEFLTAHALGSGLKLREQMATFPGTGAALILLLKQRWHGDRLALIGDSNSRDDSLYAAVAEAEGWKDISLEIAAEIEEELDGKFSGEGWRDFHYNKPFIPPL